MVSSLVRWTILTASLAAQLESRKIKVNVLKMDPYINLDPGTMSPVQHGEVFVTADGAENRSFGPRALRKVFECSNEEDQQLHDGLRLCRSYTQRAKGRVPGRALV